MASDTGQTKPTQRNPSSDDFPSGPDIGERLPPIVLQEQSGTWVDVESHRGNRRD